MESKSFCLSAAHLTMRFHVCFFVFVGVSGCLLFKKNNTCFVYDMFEGI